MTSNPTEMLASAAGDVSATGGVAAGTPTARVPAASAFVRRYTLFLLLSMSVLSYMDRQLPSILMPAIRNELRLSDSQLAFILGFAYVIFYASVGIFLGRMADRFPRRNMISLCVGFWSVMTAATGLASGFLQLALARFGVGFGEAGLAPAAQSLVSDLYSREQRTTPLAVLALGIPLGGLCAFFLGGWLSEIVGWRGTFFILGVPGVLLAVLAACTLREAPRGGADHARIGAQPPPIRQVFKSYWQAQSYRYCVLATGISGFTYGAVTQWMPSFLSRSYHLSSFTIGAWMAPCIGIGGGLGTLVSGRLVDRLQARDQRWIGWIPALALAGCAIPEAIAFAQHDVLLSLLTLCVPIILVPMHLAPFSAVVQGIGDARSRGTGVAMSLLITTTIGGGIGAQLIGLASDLLRPSLGEESLRYALLILVPLGAALASLCFMRGARTLPADLRRPTPSM